MAARILTIYPVQQRPGAVTTASAFIDATAEAHLFGVTPRAGQSEFVASPWRPAITETRDWAQETYQAPHAGIAYQVDRVRTAVARMPGGIELILLDLTVEADPAGLILAERDAYDPSVEIKLGSVTSPRERSEIPYGWKRPPRDSRFSSSRVAPPHTSPAVTRPR